jgi:hypothetical protein
MMWHTSERAGVVLGIARPGEKSSNQEVQRSTLGQLISGINPVTGKRIRKAGADGTTVGALDLTVSPAPKSVSILWALGSNELRYELELMVAQAADRAVNRMLVEQPFVRRRDEHGNIRRVRVEDYVAAGALHTTARISANGRGVADPQLHLHYLLIGALDANDQLRALDSKVLADYQAELEAVEHAIALFRARAAGIPEKRSAIVALAGLLEERRQLLKVELLSEDEGAIFNIANGYNLRHRRAGQRTDYDEVFLDWIFWWYLATIELTDRLLRRQAGAS